MKASLLLVAGVVTGSALLCAADFWKEKKPPDWNEKDAKRMISHSPWAREVSMQMGGGGGGFGGGGIGGGPDAESGGGGGFGGGGGGGGGGMGRGGGGGRGGGKGGGGMGGGSAPPATLLTVSWESAAPVLEARARLESPSPVKDLAGQYYIVSVAGMRSIMRPGQDQAQLKQRLLAGTALVRKGKDPIAAADVRGVPGEKSMTLFYFFKRDNAISEGDKEVEFVSKMGRMETKAKFKLKDMAFDGKLAL